MRDIIAQPLRARMERESTQGGEELGFGHRAKVSRCDDRAPLRQRASMTEKRLTARACCHRDRVRADRFPPSLTPSPPWCARTRRGWRRSEEHTSELQSLMRISYAVF